METNGETDENPNEASRPLGSGGCWRTTTAETGGLSEERCEKGLLVGNYEEKEKNKLLSDTAPVYYSSEQRGIYNGIAQRTRASVKASRSLDTTNGWNICIWCVYARMASKERRRNARYFIQRNYLRRRRQALFRIRNMSTQTVKYSQIQHAIFDSKTGESSRRQLAEMLWRKTKTIRLGSGCEGMCT